MIRLHLRGYPAILAGNEPLSGPETQRHRLALLALLALAPNRALARDKIFALLWPEADISNARHLLNTCVHVIRRALGDDAIISRRDELALSSAIAVDILDFEDALGRSDLEGAVTGWRAPFLDGFFLDGSPDFEQWAARERARLSASLRAALTALAEDAERRNDLHLAQHWWRQANVEDPYNTRVVSRLMLALEALGDHGNALELAREHELLLARELEAEPSADFRELVARLRSRPNGARAAPASLSPAAVVHDLPRPATPPTRHRYGVGIAALVLFSVALAVGFFARRSAPATRVLIKDFLTVSADTDVALVRAGIQAALTRQASHWSLIEVLLPDGGDLRGAPMGAGLFARQRAGTSIEGSVSATGDSIRLEARIIESDGGRVTRAVRTAWPSGADVSQEATRFAQRVLGALALTLDERLTAVTTAEHEPPLFPAYQEFLLGLEAHGKAEHDVAIDAFTRAYSMDSSFTLAAAWLARARYRGAQFAAARELAASLVRRSPPLPDADRLAMEWLLARSRGDAPAAYLAARRLADLLPRSPWVLTFASEAAASRRPAEALDRVRRLERENRWVTAWSELVFAQGEALHLLGRFRDEAEFTRLNRATATNLIVRLISEARPLAAEGRLNDIHRLVDEALALPDQPALDQGSLMQRIGTELLVHGHDSAARIILGRGREWYESKIRTEGSATPYAWGLANTLLRLGQLDTARAVLEMLHHRLPRMYSIQGALALAALRQGDVTTAERIDSMLAVPDSSWNAFDGALRIFARAKLAARRGNRAVAMRLLQDAVARGVPMPLDSVHVDLDLRGLRGYPPFDELTRLRR
jgi:DNA-binding SARP family transcriptional activator